MFYQLVNLFSSLIGSPRALCLSQINSGNDYAYIDFINKYGINASKWDYTILINLSCYF